MPTTEGDKLALIDKYELFPAPAGAQERYGQLQEAFRLAISQENLQAEVEMCYCVEGSNASPS